MEVVAEIRRLRPAWMRTMPDTAGTAFLNAFWTKRIWREVLEDSRGIHEHQLSDRTVSEYLLQHEQHSSYLVDCDLFLTADTRFASTLQIVKEDAPFAMAETRLVSGDRSVPVLERISAALPAS
ncbi:hypothetical protein [Kribbella sp. DT2]|uniref:hypothetical protein n=1 Tax=Kribbella sp. DT2 TaxID=3393427 RepID=UPI003CFAFD3B